MIRVSIVGLLLLGLLSGCSSGGATKHRYYVINPVAESSAGEVVGTSDLAVQVTSLRLPQYLDRPQIVTRRTGNSLKLAEFHQWGGNLRKDMVRVLAKNLSTLLGTPHIAIAPAHPGRHIDVAVELEVMAFERDADGYVNLSAQWRLVGGKAGDEIETRFTTIHSRVQSEENDYEQTVEQMTWSFAELSREIAAAIRGRAGHGTEQR